MVYTGKSPAVFCRFTGCNLWSGREVDRGQAVCQFCDTDFVGTDGPDGGKYDSPADLANVIQNNWPANFDGDLKKLVVCTGGEPLLQMDVKLIDALHDLEFEVAVETNGTKQPPPNVDWLCVSPKAKADLVVTSGDELKLVYPQKDCDPGSFSDLDFDCFYLQPMDGPHKERNTQLAIEYCLEHPKWSLSVQTQKVVGLR